jgi:phospholipid/cholesterol/gamma-HCH transport system permease protein
MQVRLNRHSGENSAVFEVSGDVVLDDAADLYATLRHLAAQKDVGALAIDFGEVEKLDSAGAAAVTMGRRVFERAGKAYELRSLSEQHEAALALVSEKRAPVKPRAGPKSVGERLSAGLSRLVVVAEFAEVVVDTVVSGLRSVLRRDRRRLGAVAEQTVVLGVDAWFIVTLLSFLIGVILAFQGAFQLRKFGADVYMAELVSLGMVREFAAFITAVVLAGRSGAAMAAEIGTMAVDEEVDALKSMGISPAQFLVFPRVAALTIAQPLLTVLSMAVGIGAGIATGSWVGVPPAIAYQRMQDSLALDDFALGLIKSLLFAWIIAFVGCYMGLSTRGGAQSVGKNTTMAVVVSIFFIVVTDSIVTTTWTVTHGSGRF